MSRRRIAAAVAAALAGSLGGLATAPPAAAPPVATGDVLTGNFTGDEREEMFLYSSGTGSDMLVQFDNGGVPGGDVSLTTYDFTVNGVYEPVAGDIDGDGLDEILWYAPGTAADYVWNFTSTTTYETAAYTVSGSYWPVVGDYTGDGADDVLWYAPGGSQDYLWEYDVGGTYASTTRTVNGNYVPVTGSFGTDDTDDVYWHATSGGQAYLWDFGPAGGYTSTARTSEDAYLPFALDIYGDGWRGHDIFWYNPGPAQDYLWDFIAGSSHSFNMTVNGYYQPVTGDLFGDGQDDVVWFHGNGFNLWDHTRDGEGNFVRWDYAFVAQASSGSLPEAPAPRHAEGVPERGPGAAGAVVLDAAPRQAAAEASHRLPR